MNRGAITGLPEGRLGKMAENLVTVYDWIKLKGTLEADGLRQLLDVLLKEKGVTMPNIPIVSGGTLTHTDSQRRPCGIGRFTQHN